MSFSDPIFRGCTRPAMFAGVPMVPFLLVTGAFMILAVWIFYFLTPYLALFVVMAYIPILITMRQVTKRDDQRLRQLLLRARMRFGQQSARQLWGAISFSPLRYKGRKPS